MFKIFYINFYNLFNLFILKETLLSKAKHAEKKLKSHLNWIVLERAFCVKLSQDKNNRTIQIAFDFKKGVYILYFVKEVKRFIS